MHVTNGVKYVDAHSHLHEYNDNEIEDLLESGDLVIVAVSDDYDSSLRTIRLSSNYPDMVYPCIGLHPWEVGKTPEPLRVVEEIIRLAYHNDITCLGEIGLDTKFVGETIEVQRRVFDRFLEAAADMNATLNLHTAGTWKEVLDLVAKKGITRANLHWYTGPLELLEKIKSLGYTISINPAVKIQRKHQVVVEKAPLEILLTESDSPYNYRGLKLNPLMVKDVVGKIAELKNLSKEEVMQAVRENAKRVFGIQV